MKHNVVITIILIAMFFVTQLIGLTVISADPLNLEVINGNGTLEQVPNPALGFIQPPPVDNEDQYLQELLPSIIVAFVIAILVIFTLIKFRLSTIIRYWFFFVTTIVLYITIIAFEKLMPFTIELNTAIIAAIVIALPLAYFKIFKRNLIVHNMTELMIYPGIAVVFVPLLNIVTIILLLILISLYDMWAVWHTGFMQKMAHFQMNEVKIFGGFFVPYMTKTQRQKIKKAKASKKKTKTRNVKVNLAILGGGDIVFPIITSGIVMGVLGLKAALVTTLGATVALTLLFIYSTKGKFYPAMPFITAGLFAGMAIGYLL